MSRTYRWKLALSAIFLGGVTVLATQGCTVTTSNNDPFDDAGPGRDTGNNPPPPQNCDECVYQGCTGQYARCTRNNDCMRIYSCATNCTTGDINRCVNSCYDSYPNGQQLYSALAQCNGYYACQTTTCQSLCQSSYGCTPGQDAGTAPATCAQCTDQRCSSQKANCQGGSDCEAYSLCTNNCTDPDPDKALECVDLCGQAHQPGKTASESLATCTEGQCSTECKFQ